jgi:hypothetical protein
VLDFVRSHTFTPSDFVLATHGVCRLHPQLARQVGQLGVNEVLAHEIVSSMVRDLKTVHAK